MSDLKGQEIRDSYQDLLTKGSGTAIEDGDGNSFIGAIVDNLTSTDTNAPLSANQGKQLQDTKVAKSGDTMSGLLRLTAGLNFNASGGNTLSDYEVGTWTPTFTSEDGDFGAFAYEARSGNYIRIGDLVIANFSLIGRYTDIGDAGGAVEITGLPLTLDEMYGGLVRRIRRWDLSPVTPINIVTVGGNIRLLKQNANDFEILFVNVSEMDLGTNFRNFITGALIYKT